jgi:tRNA (cytidine32/uridine32-2'-O)-methyltransferase
MSDRKLTLAVHGLTSFVLVRPHYPENVGACARAIKTVGFDKLVLVKPSRLAQPEHEMAFKMAVRSWDVLHAACRFETLEQALTGADWVLATSSHRGISGVTTPRDVAPDVIAQTSLGKRVAILFGNEKTGLSEQELGVASTFVRIPMAADQPSINLSQAVQLVAYELFLAALAARAAEKA